MGRCSLCKKKCGLLVIECKGCKKAFCNLHRLPEDHQCEHIVEYLQGLKEQLNDSFKKQQHDLKDMKLRNNFVRM
jgi:predicted nucleic acid binding AN1-type Zn finger protein